MIFVKFCHCCFAEAYSFLELFIGVGAIDNENHQLVVRYSADVFTIWKDVYFLHIGH